MKNTYNKGRYRNGEWAKHLRPFLKKLGNRKWRLEGRLQAKSVVFLNDEPSLEIEQEAEKVSKRLPRKQKKKIKVKITTTEFKEHVKTTVRKYHSSKAVKSAIARNNVVRYYIYNEK
jgi:hypothetical protein